MEYLEISNKSWHCRYLRYHDKYVGYMNSCSYLRALIGCIFWDVIFCMVGVAIAAAIADITAWLVVSILYDFPKMHITTIGTLGMLIAVIGLIIAAMFIVATIIGMLSILIDRRGGYKEPGMLTKLYRSWKEKYCLPVKVKYDN